MAVVRLEIKTRQALADGRKFDHVGCYEQLDGTAHFAVNPAHRLNCAVTDIDLAERRRDGLVHFTADVRILAPADQTRGNHRLLFDVPNRGNRLALATFNGVPRPINPAGPTDGQWFEPGLVRLDPGSIKPSGPRRSTPRRIAWYTPCFEVPASRATATGVNPDMARAKAGPRKICTLR